MKKIDKLATEYQHTGVTYNFLVGEFEMASRNIIESAFKAGFLKAIELASKRAQAWNMSDKYPNDLALALEELAKEEE